MITILRNIKSENRDMLFKSQNLRNMWAKNRLLFLNCKTFIQTLIFFLSKNKNWTYNYRLNENENEKVMTLFLTHKFCLKLLKENFYVLTMNCTYKTNRYKMFLLNIIKNMFLNKTFYVEFCFLNDEKKKNYDWVLKCLRLIFKTFIFENSRVILMNYDKSFLNVIDQIFFEIIDMICIWHINQNVIKIMKFLIKRDIQTANFDIQKLIYDVVVTKMKKNIYKNWNKVINSQTKKKFEQK